MLARMMRSIEATHCTVYEYTVHFYSGPLTRTILMSIPHKTNVVQYRYLGNPDTREIIN
jgi:hypothetical protein